MWTSGMMWGKNDLFNKWYWINLISLWQKNALWLPPHYAEKLVLDWSLTQIWRTIEICLENSKGKLSPRILYPVKLSIKSESKLKTFSEVQCFRNYTAFVYPPKNLLEDARLKKKQKNKTRKGKTWASGNEGIRCGKETKGILRSMVKGDSSMRAVHWARE